MLTSGPPGSPLWASRYPGGSVLFDGVQSSQTIQGDVHFLDAVQSSSTIAENAHISGSRERRSSDDTERSYTENSEGGFPNDNGATGSGENHYTPGSSIKEPEIDDIQDPIDIFGTSPAHPANRIDTEMALRSSKKLKYTAVRLPRIPQVAESFSERLESLGLLPRRVSALRKEASEPESSYGGSDNPCILSPGSRRVASQTDHPLKCATPLNIEDAETESSKGRSNDGHCLSPCFLRVASRTDHPNKALRRHRPASHSDISSHKSVRFDPAIISLGSERRIARSESAIPKPISRYEPKLPRFRTEINEKEEPRLRSKTNENGKPRLKDYVQTILSLKKHERAQLRDLLEKLSKIEDSPPIAHSAPPTKKTLDPRAPEYHGSLRTPHALCGPVCQHGQSTLPVRQNHPRPNLPPIWIHIHRPRELLAQAVVPVFPTFQRPQSMPAPIPTVNKFPTIDDGNGREAKAVDSDWSKSILEKFVAKYPLTGTVKAAAPVDSKKRHATAIQQRLEYLLMQEREKNAIRPQKFDEEHEKDRENAKNNENMDPTKQ